MNKKFNIVFILIFCALAVVLYAAVFYSDWNAGAQADDSPHGIKPGKRQAAQEFTLTDLDGRRVRLSDLRGKVVFLNFWATWCAPCRSEFPSLIDLRKRFAGKDFQMLTISIDEGGRQAVEKFFRQTGFSLPTLIDQKSEAARRFGIVGVPESFLIDKNGKVAKKYIGPYNWSSPVITQTIERLLSAPAS